MPIRPQSSLSFDELRSKAWLFGFLAGDGSLEKSRVKFHPGTDEEMAKELIRVINRLYGGDIATLSKQKNAWVVSASRTEIVKDILESCSPWWEVEGRRGWGIPGWVGAHNGLLAMFIQGLAEADGCAGKECIVVVTTVYEPGAKEIQKALLEHFNITAGLYFGGPYASVRVSRKDELEKFAKEIGFTSKTKTERLERLLESFSYRRRLGDFAKAAPIVQQAINEGRPPQEVVSILDEKIPGSPWNREQVSKVIQKHKLKGYGKGQGTKQYLNIIVQQDRIRELADSGKTSAEASIVLAEEGLSISPDTLRHSARKLGILFKGRGGVCRARKGRFEKASELYDLAIKDLPGGVGIGQLEALGEGWTAEGISLVAGGKNNLYRLMAPRVIKLLGEGNLSARDVAQKLGLTENTVTYLWKKTLKKT